jgi:hypothetical protein
VGLEGQEVNNATSDSLETNMTNQWNQAWGKWWRQKIYVFRIQIQDMRYEKRTSFWSHSIPFVYFLNQSLPIISEMKSATNEKIGFAVSSVSTPPDLAET